MRFVLMLASPLLLALCLFGTFSGSASDVVDGRFQEALGLVDAQNYAQAVKILEGLIPEIKTPETKARYCYVAATCYRKLGQWAKAIPCYQMVLEEKEFPFADLAMFHIGNGYRNTGDNMAAIGWYEKILLLYPGSSISTEAHYQLAECHFTLRQFDLALSHYTTFVKDNPEDSRVRMAKYKIAACYRELKQCSAAYTWYRDLIRENMKDEVARNSVDRIKSMMSSDPTLTISRDDRILYGQALYYGKQYEAAREELRKVIVDSDSLSIEAAYFIAESYFYGKEYSAAVKEYSALTKRYPESDYAAMSYYQIALCRGKMGMKSAANILLAEFASMYPNSYLADNALFQIVENYMEEEDYAEAANACGNVVTKYPSSSLADDALWDMGWCYLKLGLNEKSAEAFRQLLTGYPDSQSAGSARFWAGVSCERAEKWLEAADLYRKSVQNRDWYYSDRAKKRLELLAGRKKIDPDTAAVQYEKVRIDESVPAWQNIQSNMPVRVQKLLDLRIFDDAISELLANVKAKTSQESAYYRLSECHKSLREFHKSRSYAWKLSTLPGMKSEGDGMPLDLHRMLYPVVYRDEIFSNSAKNGIDPLLTLALMREESGYNPAAISSAGAMGLIQIMPATGKDVAGRMGIPRFQTDMLLQPETNIKMGVWYLAHLSGRLNDYVHDSVKAENSSQPEVDYSDIVRILAVGSYNGGESRVRRWVEKYGLGDIDEFVESIPLYETKRYIKKVCDSYEVYRALYVK